MVLSLSGKRIVFVHFNLEMGGAERQSLLLARYLLLEHNAHVEFVGIAKAGRLAQLCQEAGIPWRILGLRYSGRVGGGRLNFILSLARSAFALRLMQPDILMPYSILSNVICGLVWQRTGAQLCVWNQRDEGMRINKPGFEKQAIRQTPLLIANSPQGSDFLVEVLKASADRVHIVNNGVEVTGHKAKSETWLRKLGISHDYYVACMLANLTAQKDHVTLIKAWRKVIDCLSSQGIPAVLLLAGYFGGTEASLQALVHDLNLGCSVRFLGQVDDTSGLLSVVDVGILSSTSEGCPNGVLECMAAGLPVVGSDISGIRYALGPESYAFLAPLGDSSALADRIIKLATNPGLRQDLGRANRRRIEKRFGVERMGREMASLIGSNVCARRIGT
jgi:glycosyltransferase involved in cell wall biosynthesis